MTRPTSSRPHRPDFALTCASCRHCRERRQTDKQVEAGHQFDDQWCAANDMPTVLTALRCGGDDYEKKP